MNLKDIFRKIKNNKKIKEEIKKKGCITYCYHCKEPFLEGTSSNILSEEGLYEYTCKHCLKKSVFHYGLAPVPIFIGTDKLPNFLNK